VRPGELALQMTYVLRAPAARLFRACTEPQELAKWWGPRGFITPTIELDLRVGGRYRFAMQPQEGDLFHLTGEFREVDPPSRLTYTFVWEPRTQMTGRRLSRCRFASWMGRPRWI
jgi:uncharacterized protein YndB with AHSA1/START domain